MSKVSQAFTVFNNHQDKARKQIIALIMEATDSGEAYSSTLYNKARKVGTASAPKKKVMKQKKVIDVSKVAFLKNCWKIQGLKGGHYNANVKVGIEYVTAVGVNKNKELMCVKTGTNVRVKVNTAKVMKELRKMKFLGAKK